MFARVAAATFCCALGCLPVVGAESDLVVYLNSNGDPSSPSVALMRHEADKLMRAAGYSIQWRESKSHRAGEDADNLVFFALTGSCSVPMSPVTGALPPDDNQPSLASTAVENGVVLPFSRIDCSAVNRVLSFALAREAPARRTFLYGRALGRVLAHELYHVLANTRDHTASGIGKPCFTSSDLIADRFEFESVALARLRHRISDRGTVPPVSPATEFTGR